MTADDELERVVAWLRGQGSNGYAGRTWQVARAIGTNTGQARRYLIRLEKRGLVMRDLLRSSVNDIMWSLTADALARHEHRETNDAV